MIRLSPASAAGPRVIEAIFEELGGYSMRVDGRPRREGAALEFVTAVPPGCDPRDKHAFVADEDGRPVGLLDLIDGIPRPGVAFIGLLAVRESVGGRGLGRELYAEAERYARDRLGARTIRLAIVTTNPVLGFWRKMGFAPTGEAKPYGETKPYGDADPPSRAVFLEKALASARA